MKIFATLFLLLTTLEIVTAQINNTDSTAQVIGYWDNHEKQSYKVDYIKYKVKNQQDTTDRVKISYNVDITITDSTSNSYKIEWHYKNYQIDTNLELLKKISAIADDIKVVIKTDEMGAFTDLVNYKEVQDYIKKSTKKLKAEFKDIPKIEDIIKEIEKNYSSKEAIKALAIKDIHQFYSFHGAKYKLNEELNTTLKQENLLGGDPFDTEVTVIMDEINPDDNNVVIRMWQTVDPEQLTEATFNYMAKLSSEMKLPAPKREDIKNLRNETRLGSRIHASSGWVIYSIETKEISAEGVTNVEERIIEIL